MSPRLPEAIGVYGVSGHTLNLLELCSRLGVQVEFVVDDEPDDRREAHTQGWSAFNIRCGVENRRIPLWSREAFFRAAKWGTVNVPLFAACIGSEIGRTPDDDPFLNAAAELRRECGPSLPLWHPASLGAAARLPKCPGRVAFFGFRGCGNVLAQALAGTLLQAAPADIHPNVSWMANFVEHLFATCFNLIRTRLSERIAIAKIDCTPEEYPTMFVTLTTEAGDMAAVLNIPSNRHFAQYFYWTHSTLSDEVVAEFSRLHIPLIAIVRHPFETILALASKCNRPPDEIINDPAWLDHHAEGLAIWLRRLRAHRDRALVIRYEDLIARDPGVLERMAGAIGVPFARDDADRLYDQHLFRDLLPGTAPGHFNRGGQDKWKRYFGSRHRDAFLRHGFRELFAEFGYEGIDEPGEPTPAPVTEPSKPFQVQYSGAVTHRFFSEPEWERLPGEVPYLLKATSPSLGRSVAEVMLSEELAAVFHAGGMGLETPPWVKPFDWSEVRATVR